MAIKKVFTILVAVILLVFMLFLLIFDRYRYQDLVVENCKADQIHFDVELIGSFSHNFPKKRGSPYHLRIEMNDSKNKDIENIFPEKLYLEMDKTSERYPLILSNNVDSGSNTFLFENINIPYEEYTLIGTFLSTGKNELDTRIPFECDVKMTPSSEYRITLWDNLLSV